MKKEKVCLIVSIVVMAVFLISATNVVSAQLIAYSFQFPVDGYCSGDGCREWGVYASSGKRHLGDDFCVPVDTQVNATADGIVKFAKKWKTCPNWGYLIIIEHTLPDNSKVCTLYGHVKPTVAEDAIVYKGDKVGTIAHFSCWSDHIHFAVYSGPYGITTGTYYNWTAGYASPANWPKADPCAPTCGDYLDPIEFINSHSSVPSIYVPDDYPTIQAAIDSAEEGDTIIVRDGTYTENVKVNKDHLTIKSMNGAETTIVQAANDHVFEITADYVNISGFTATRTLRNWVGFSIVNNNYCNISYNTITNNNCSIYLHNSNNNIVSGNTINENYCGIMLHDSSGNAISANTVDESISLWYSSGNTISGNNINDSNYNHGIWMYYSNNNIIYLNNFINNTNNVYSLDSVNIWNSPEKITYAYNGNIYTNYLGNYWDDYTGSDINEDGIGDEPYDIYGAYGSYNNTDDYPLTQPFENYLLKESSAMEIKAFCPVNLSVSDPDGLVINPETNEIPGASYAEEDINGDGDLDDIISILNRKTGSYEITVIPEPNAESTDTYTLEVSANDTTIILAEDVLISDIPSNPYEIESNETGIADKTLVDPEGGIGIAVLPRINHITSGDTVNFTVKIVSTENFDDVFHL